MILVLEPLLEDLREAELIFYYRYLHPKECSTGALGYGSASK